MPKVSETRHGEGEAAAAGQEGKGGRPAAEEDARAEADVAAAGQEGKGGRPVSEEDARAEADVAAKLREERDQLLKDTSFFAILCPSRTGDKDKDSKDDATGSAPKAKEVGRVPLFGKRGLFRFADCSDITMYVFAIICSAGLGAIMPLFALIFGELLDAMNSGDPAVVTREMDTVSLYFVYLAVGAGLFSWGQVAFPTIAAERQAVRMRAAYADSLLKQDVTFFETEQDPAEVASLLVDSSVQIINGTGKAIGTAVQTSTTAVVGLTLGFVAAWDMSLVIIGIVPLFALPMMALSNSKDVMERTNASAYARAQSVASEALSIIRTVRAFGGHEAEARRYESHLELAELVAMRTGRVLGFGMGSLWFFMMLSYAAGMAFGAHRIRTSRANNPLCAFAVTAEGPTADCFTPGKLMEAFFAILIGGSTLGQVSPAVGTIMAARGAAARVFATIDRESAIDPSASKGLRPEGRARGRVEFKDVTFAFPSNPDRQVLKSFSVVVEPGTTLALVGESGSGKSTIVQLLMRFYDPDEGSILLDGKDIREYDVSELRDRIGLVGQEPALFSDTIHYNIAYGRRGGLPSKPLPDLGLGTDTHPSVTECRGAVEDAARSAFAHGFIEERLPLGYSTFAGVQGSSRLSGGQKQRVAIARSLVRKPGFLIGDEVTSALDSQSEKEVQRALDTMLAEAKRSSLDRTSVFVAHRLSTIRAADQILVLQGGKLKERGTHDALMAMGGLYAGLARAQQMAGARAASSEEDDEAAAAAPAAAAAAGTE